MKQQNRGCFTEQPVGRKRVGSRMSLNIFKLQQNGNCLTVLGLRRCTECTHTHLDKYINVIEIMK